VSFDALKLAENYAVALEEVLRLKPSASKGRYIQKATVATTFGPGISVDPNVTKVLTEVYSSKARTKRPSRDCGAVFSAFCGPARLSR
jgi:hypothetical protein